MLGELLRRAATRAESLRPRRQAMEAGIRELPSPPAIVAALSRPDIAVIAELKRASPSKGAIRPAIDAAAQATAYEAGGAAAISVLTEASSFGALPGDLETVSAATRIPLLRKDFMVSEDQITEARLAGASAVLIIVRALPPSRIETLAAHTRALAMEPLLEAHSEADLDLALETGSPLIGVNARDLETLAMRSDLVETLAPRVPAGRICIAESGLAGRGDVERVAEAGVDAVLVGSMLSAADDPEAAVRSLTGVPRRARASRR